MSSQITNSQKMLTTCRIAGGRFCMGEKLMWHLPVGSNAVGCSSRADAVKLFFASMYAAVTYNAFQLAEKNKKLPFPVRESGPHLTHGFLGPPDTHANGISIASGVFVGSRTWPTDRHTDRQNHATPSVATGSISAMHMMRLINTTRLVGPWNQLPAHVVEAPSVNAFKNH